MDRNGRAGYERKEQKGKGEEGMGWDRKTREGMRGTRMG